MRVGGEGEGERLRMRAKGEGESGGERERIHSPYSLNPGSSEGEG